MVPLHLKATNMADTGLSVREREIADAYAQGNNYRQIAERFFISPSTVRTHLATIYRKLGVSSKLELHEVLGGGALQSKSFEEQAILISELALGLEEAIGRQRALSEVLRIISRSEDEVEDVVTAVLGYALQLCDAQFGVLFSFNPEDGFKATHIKEIPQPFQDWFLEQSWFHVGAQTGLGRMAASNSIINIPDICAEEIYRYGDPLRDATADLGRARSFTAIPMLDGGHLIGAFTLYRQQVRPFDDKSLQLAQIFADQSVIAIENARLVSELREKR